MNVVGEFCLDVLSKNRNLKKNCHTNSSGFLDDFHAESLTFLVCQNGDLYNQYGNNNLKCERNLMNHHSQ